MIEWHPTNLTGEYTDNTKTRYTMSIFPIVAMIFGVIVALGSFTFAAFNMARSQDSDFAFQDGFEKHIGAMVGVACGGVIMVLGGLLALVEVLRQIFG